jgi:predicted translin family RNA/ssDNA-binding protein
MLFIALFYFFLSRLFTENRIEVSEGRLVQIMNLLKLAPEIQEYLKKLNDPSRLGSGIRDKQTQVEKL